MQQLPILSFLVTGKWGWRKNSSIQIQYKKPDDCCRKGSDGFASTPECQQLCSTLKSLVTVPCLVPCTKICSRVCSFGLSSHGVEHNGPTVYSSFPLSNLPVSQQICASAQHKQCALAALPHCPLSSAWGDSSSGV